MRERTPTLAVAVLVMALVLPAPLYAQDATGGEPIDPAVPAAEPAAPVPADPPAGEAPAPEVTQEPATPTPEPTDPADPAVEAPAAPVAPATPVAVRQGGIAVSMIDYAYEPASVQVDVGGSITFVNDGPDEPHTATASDGSWDTGEVAVGGSSTITFSRAGTFPYICALHPNMKGSVTVLAEDTGGGASPTAGDGGSSGTPSGVPGPTEEAAVASPDAAGTSTALPATGAETGLLAAAGLALLACGLQLFAAQRLARRC